MGPKKKTSYEEDIMEQIEEIVKKKLNRFDEKYKKEV
jgi:hypothetical protein